MGMQTYLLEEKAAFNINEQTAAAIVLHDMYENDPGCISPEIKEALDNGMTCWEAASSKDFYAWLDYNNYFDVSMARDILENNNDDSQLVHCEQFTGGAETADGFKDMNPDGEDLNWDSYMALFLTTKNSPTLFKAAYGSPQEIIEEYRQILEPYLGKGFDYAKYIVDVSGWYFC